MTDKNTLFLIGLNAALAALLVGVMVWPLAEVSRPDAAPPPANAPARAKAPERAAPIPSPAGAHPVFWPRPAAAPVAVPPPAPPVAPEQQTMPKLVGLIVRNGVGLAIFEGAGDTQTRALGEGETFAGWTLERIAARSVRLVQNGHRIIVPLDPGPPP